MKNMAHHSQPSCGILTVDFILQLCTSAIAASVLMQCWPCGTILMFAVVWPPRVLRILFVALGQKSLCSLPWVIL